jgi:hypothetical protein
MNPPGGIRFNQPHNLCNGIVSAEGDEQMHVIGHAAGRKQPADIASEDAADVFKQTWLQFEIDPRLALFGAEYNVRVQGCVGLRHGIAPEFEEMDILCAKNDNRVKGLSPLRG